MDALLKARLRRDIRMTVIPASIERFREAVRLPENETKDVYEVAREVGIETFRDFAPTFPALNDADAAWLIRNYQRLSESAFVDEIARSYRLAEPEVEYVS